MSEDGVLHAIGDGVATVSVAVAGRTFDVAVTVQGTQEPRSLHFTHDIEPILSRFGCNTSGCHGKAEGQNGFKLSVFGFDPDADRSSLLSEGRGRRVFPAAPERSLLLQKAAGGMPHGGGVRIRRGSGEYRLLREWIAAGMPAGEEEAPHVVSVELTPAERRMKPNDTQQLRLIATWSDGRTADVTSHARFQSNSDALARVDEFGHVTAGDTPGEAAVMASYMGAVDVFHLLLPRMDENFQFTQRPVRNFIDEHVDRRLKKLNISPSELCSDAEFLRRVSLDLTGTLPTEEEARRFLAGSVTEAGEATSAARRARLVNELLERPEFADLQALRWADLLRVDRQKLGHKGAWEFYRWIHESFATSQPLDEFAAGVIAAEGLLHRNPPGNLYKVITDPGDMASTLSQVFLGIRIECARCHHHPFDRWSQTDYYGMQAFFTQTGFKATPRGQMIAALKNTPTRHPRTKEVIFAHPLGTENPAASPEGDRRRILADWLTSPENPAFARNIANRTWAWLFGRGIINPVDDVRLTNPPSNPELLDALAASLIDSGYDLKQLIRTITASRTYQLSSAPNETNLHDEQNWSRSLFRQVEAEVLLDAVCQVSGIPEKFEGLPAGGRAIELWDSRVPHYFLRVFGRPLRVSACECERITEPTVSQVLHVLNSPEIHAKLAHENGRLARLVEQQPDDGALVESLYLRFYSRFPESEERAAAVEYLTAHSSDRRRAVEDVAWSMMNTIEFLMNH
ncbi:MAG: DUF1553 domain-containing protein [Planctomycetaceae bacterium]|nr:DUF1553 domain-containing protein [Planctomycetaceae bacterium]